MHKKLNILLLSGTPPYEHSGILALDIVNSLKEEGHQVELITKFYDKRFEDNVKSAYGFIASLVVKVKNRLVKLIPAKKRQTDFDYYIFDLGYSKKKVSTNRILFKKSFNPDLIIYLFPHFFLNEENLFELNKKTGAPIILFPVDMDPLTGGCHYFWSCDRYTTGCGSCPGIYSDDPNDITHKNILYKKHFIDRTDVYPVGGDYMLNIINKSFLYRAKRGFNIDLVVNERKFLPGNKTRAREYFNLPQDKKIIFFGALSLNERRKGLKYLVEALVLLSETLTLTERDDIVIVMAGALKDSIKSDIPFPVYQLGWLNQEQLPLAFQAGDLFVCPSIEDAGPMMTIQSLMCGVPVVAFKTGNATEMIANGVTGYRAALCNVDELKDGILKILRLNEEDKELMNKNCRELTFSRSSYGAFVKRIEKAYESIKNDVN